MKKVYCIIEFCSHWEIDNNYSDDYICDSLVFGSKEDAENYIYKKFGSDPRFTYNERNREWEIELDRDDEYNYDDDDEFADYDEVIIYIKELYFYE